MLDREVRGPVGASEVEFSRSGQPGQAVVAMGARDGESIAGEAGTQSWVPPGPAYELFDQASIKMIDQETN